MTSGVVLRDVEESDLPIFFGVLAVIRRAISTKI
jgi:hypothetical protein